MGVESNDGWCEWDRNWTPPKKQKRYYSGKQKCHTLKAQLLADFTTGQIICTTIDTGKTHDFKLLGRSRLPFVSSQLCLADRGYQGFTKRHAGACTPTFETAQPTFAQGRLAAQPLPWHDCAFELVHLIRRFKIFRIFSGRYRNP